MKLSLPARVLIGFVGGSVAGAAAFWWTQHGGEAGVISVIVDSIAQPAGQLFLKFLKMLVLPLMFSALVVGVTEIGDIASLGRIGWRMLFYTALLTSIAIGVGLLVINLVQPGVGFDPAIRDSLLAANTQAAHEITATKPTLSGVQIIMGIVPDNPIKAAANGDFLGVVAFIDPKGECLRVTVEPSPDGSRFYMLDTKRDANLYRMCMEARGWTAE